MQTIKLVELCHNVNKAICEAAGDFSQEDFSDIPEWKLIATT